MVKKIEKIKEILDNEKRKKEIKEANLKVMKNKKQEKVRKAKELSEKWAMYRWTVAYIDEKKDQWDYEKIQREEDLEILQIVEETEEKKRKEDSENKEIIEIVEQHEKKSKKRKLEQELEPETPVDQNQEKLKYSEFDPPYANKQQDLENENNWKVWRNNEIKEITQITETQEKTTTKTTNDPEIEQQLQVKLKQPKLIELFRKVETKQQERKDTTMVEQQENEKPTISNTENDNKLKENIKKPAKSKTKQQKLNVVLKPPKIKPPDPKVETKPKVATIKDFFGKQQQKQQTTESKPETTINKKQHQKNNKPNKNNQIVAQSRGYWIKLAEEQRLRKLKKTEVPSAHAKTKVVENKLIADNKLQNTGQLKDQHGLESLVNGSQSSNNGNNKVLFESESALEPQNRKGKGKSIRLPAE